MRVSVPVSPYIATVLDADNVVLSLLGLAPRANLTFPVRPPSNAPKDAYSKLRYSIKEVELQVMIDLGISGAVTFASKTDAQTFFFLWDLAVDLDPILNNDPNSVIVAAIFSVGVRICVFAFSLDTSIKADIFKVAAQATLKQASTAYQVVILGAGLEAIDPLKPLITSSTGPFAVETVQTMGAVQSDLYRLLYEHPEKLTPALTEVTIDTDKLAQAISAPVVEQDLTAVLEAHTFAMERASRSIDAKDAAQQASQHGVNADIVQQGYQNVLGLSGSQPVPQDKRELAHKILMAGRK